MPRISVFLSYVDSFVGARLLSQFQQFPEHYQVYGCTWDAAAAEKLNAAASAAYQQKMARASIASGGTGIGATLPVIGDVDDEDSSDMERSNGTMTPGPGARADTAPLPEELSTTHRDVEGDAEAAEARPGSRGSPSATGGVSFVSISGAAGAEKPPRPHTTCTFFSRLDTLAVRAALLACDWIVLELRHAQTVLEVVQLLQTQPSFARAKRLVLLSSLMTWYATPSLQDDEAAAAAAAAGGGGGAAEAAGRDDGEDGPGGDGEDDVEAPYPPAPPRFLEAIVAAAQDRSRYAVADAMRGDKPAEKQGGDVGDGDGEEDGDGDGDGTRTPGADPAAADTGAEVLTEDQYNRRVPHLHYLSWRDAEKAVAAAHHAKGLPLTTFVVCSGLPYGGEEDVLEPLFRLAWSAEAEQRRAGDPAASTPSAASLPIFGSGQQRVPLVHAQDLACFVRKLLRCPEDALPFPERRYLFATDGSNKNSWHTIVSAVNGMFGGRCALQSIAPASYPLYRDVERFTMDLRVEPETMRTIMARVEDAEDGGEAHGAAAATAVTAPPQSPPPLPNTWIAEGGIRRHHRAIADEFAAARHVDPLRIAIVGPPLAGKTYLATRVARYYRLPCVSLRSVVADYTAALAELRTRGESTKAAVRTAERTRRLGLKRRRLLARQQREWDAQAERGGAVAAGAGDGAAAVGGENNSNNSRNQDTADAADLASRASYRAGGSVNRSSHFSGAGGDAPSGAGGRTSAAAALVLDDQEVSAAALALTAAEEEELDAFVTEWWADQPQAHAWAAKVAEMERVLLLRLHPRPPTPEVNPKKKAAGAGAGGGGANAKKKNNKDAQKTREEEEELQLLKAALQHAPLQPRALALMLRWRLAQPDCRVQGFVLDGVPTTLELARLVFGEGEEEQLQPPLTEEEALRPRYAAEGGAAAAAAAAAAAGADGGDDGHEDKEPGAAKAAPPKEPASDARLPNHVVVLQASDTYLLNRLKAMGAAAEDGAVTARGHDDATRAVDVEGFHHALQTYKWEYVDTPYSVLSYWECAAATTAPLLSTGSTAGAERRTEVHLVAVEGNEPLVPPIPPLSAHAAPVVSSTEQLLEQVILGLPHNFGKSLEETQREAVRQRCLREEEEDAHAQKVAAQAAAESLECAQESEARSVAEERLLALKQADVAELEARKRPMASYLQERVLPLLHKGLLEVCAARPADPVDYLAEWLIRHNPHDDIFCDL
ncbi:Dpy-30 motif containing protein [Novymonas esmeraldas]|uniref:Dpy-30 motif containing protein n=1 Tax=Novymonas esmeraldas TaxID=1808958 RepID=A0AAW0EZ62_9TRYP